jgi:integrase
MSLFDDLDTVSKFVESWSNLVTREPLADSTRKTELERFRAFLAYSLDRNWVRFNHAKKIKFSFKTEPKYGMSSDEEYRLFADIHSDELRAFCLVMRWAGLRISDATTLNDSQLIERASGNGWAIRIEQTKKTREPVYVPIPSFVEAALRQLPHKYETHGRRYWFWSGECELETAKNNWYTKIMRVVNRNKFLHAVTPHTFRHTFAISHLNAGVDVKLVSRWLSHASVVVTEKHYAQAIHGTLVASDEAFDASIKKQRQVMTA